MVAILEATNMSEGDLRMTLDGETTWVLGQPSPLAAPAQAAHEALRSTHEAATPATDPFSPDDAPAGVGFDDQAGRVEMEAGRDLRVGPTAEAVRVGRRRPLHLRAQPRRLPADRARARRRPLMDFADLFAVVAFRDRVYSWEVCSDAWAL